MSWFLGAMTKNFDTDVIANGRGSLDFLRFFKATFYKKYFCILLYCRVCHILCKQIFRKFSSVLANSAQDVRRRRNPETSCNIVFLRKYTIIIFFVKRKKKYETFHILKMKTLKKKFK